jgi:hypothetical protein
MIIPSGNISMSGINYPIHASNADTGEYLTTMQPGGQYNFDAQNILEEPVYAQKGKVIGSFVNQYATNKKPLNYFAGAVAPVMGAKASNNSDSIFEDVGEIFDPTGISSYDDVYRAYQQYKDGQAKWYDVALETAGAFPVVGKIGKGAKLASKAAKYIDFGSDAISLASILGTDYKQKAGYTKSYYEKLLENPEVQELITLRSNVKQGYGDARRLAELETKHGRNYDMSAKQNKRIANKPVITKKEVTAEVAKETPADKKIISKFTKQEVAEYNSLLAQEKRIKAAKLVADEKELATLIQEEERIKTAKDGFKRLKKLSFTKDAPLADLSNYGSRSITDEEFLRKAAAEKNMELYPIQKMQLPNGKQAATTVGKSLFNATPGKTKLSKIASIIGGGYLGYEAIKNSLDGIQETYLPEEKKINKGASGSYGLPSVKSKNLVVKGKDRNYNLTYDRDNKPDGTSLYQDEDGNRWQKDKDGRVKIIWRPGQDSNKGTGTGGGTGGGKPAPVTTATLPKFDFMLKDLTDAEIEASGQNLPGATPVNNTPRTVNLDTVGGEKNWLGSNGSSITTVGTAGQAQKPQQFKFNTKNLLNGMIAQNNVANAYQPIALPFRRHISLEAPQQNLIDQNTVLGPLMQAFDKSVAGINPNSTTGQAFKSSLFGKLIETLPNVLNDLNNKNQEISYANNVSLANARNKQQEFNMAADSKAYDTMLQSYANRDAGILTALQGVANLNTDQRERNAKLDGYLMENPYLEEKTSFLDGFLGNRSFEMDPEYRKIVKTNRILAEQKAEADKAKTAKA